MITLYDGEHAPEDEKGLAKGFSVQWSEVTKALKSVGVRVTNSIGEADIVFHQAPVFKVDYIPGKLNVLYTAWEADKLPEEYATIAKNMDLVICVSKYCAKTFKKYTKKVVTVPLGVDGRLFSYKKRKYSTPFRFLWLNAPSPRKGWHIIQEAWFNFSKRDDVELYIKTTRAAQSRLKAGNVFIDTRDLNRGKLADLYHSAHCFIHTSFAEGFGLTLIEAMATGLPCIYVPYSGVLEFANISKCGYPLSYKEREVSYAGIKTVGAEALVSDLIFKMFTVKKEYKRAVMRGKRASEHVTKNFSWKNTGLKLRKILEEFLNGKLNYSN